MTARATWQARLPFYFGWVIVAIAFVTMAVAISARTSFSLLLPPLLDEYGWDRGVVAGAFSIGYIASAVTGPFVGRLVDARGPRGVLMAGLALLVGGLLAAPVITTPWHLYATLGLMVGFGATLMTYMVQSLYLPHWFARHRALAISIAFSGAGAGAIVLLPWFQSLIDGEGWRYACIAMAILVLGVLAPLTLFVRGRPQELGLEPDGAAPASDAGGQAAASNIVDHEWAAVTWTQAKALRTARLWWILLGFSCNLFAWYAIQVHQTRYLTELGFSPLLAAWALGLVAVVAIPGQIGFGALSDRVGREWVWTISCAGFAISYGALIALNHWPSTPLLYFMVVSQGLLGYCMTSVMGAIVIEIFEGPHFGAIFGIGTIGLVTGAGSGPWITGLIYDFTGSYAPAFWLGIGLCVLSAIAIWVAAPRKVRLVPGRVRAQG